MISEQEQELELCSYVAARSNWTFAVNMLYYVFMQIHGNGAAVCSISIGGIGCAIDSECSSGVASSLNVGPSGGTCTRAPVAEATFSPITGTFVPPPPNGAAPGM